MWSATCTPCVPSHGGTPKRLTDCVWEGMPGVICGLVEENKKTGKAGLLWELRQLQINQRLIFFSHWPNKGMLWIKGYLSVWVLQ